MKSSQLLSPFYLLSLLAIALLATTGCGGPSRIDAPEFDAAGSAQEAMSLYDADSDGFLADAELDACPAIKGAIEEIDEDGDGQVSQDEIQKRIEFFVQTRVGRQSLACLVSSKSGAPMPGVTVRFVPEPFMASVIKEATGTTKQNGMANINIADQLGGVQTGFYKVELSRQSRSGKESINKKYNEETILGQEVTTGSIQLSQGLVFKI